MPNIDLHFHTQLSDGANNNEEIIETAHKEKISFLCATEHDIVNLKLRDLAESEGIDSCEGVEISACNYDTQKHLHLPCYTNQFSTQTHIILEGVREARKKKISKQIELLQSQGFHINEIDFIKYFTDLGVNTANLNNYHLSYYIYLSKDNTDLLESILHLKLDQIGFLKECLRQSGKFGEIGSVQVENYEPAIEEAGKIASDNFGVLSIAHPNFSFSDEGTHGFIESFSDYHDRGVNAIEINALASPEWIEAILKIQKKFNLILTFGSDCHEIGKRDKKHGSLGDINPHIDQDFIKAHFKVFHKKVFGY
ncbi:hypothetical protein A9Q91_05515 [Candidatus Gracilibacteria bacterium 28_42_T64]|nr:hypothetical protein A9Q91_05515 [Candidatus Gracilibacteria bacterium 28_42_T64]